MSTTTASYRTDSPLFAPGERLTARPRAAGRLKRMGAFSIDVLVYGALTSLFTIILSLFGTTLASLLYASFHDCAVGPGRSLGRAAVDHRLMHTDGHAVSYGTANARNALRWLMWTTVLLFVVDLVLFFTSGRLLADYILGTQVSEDPAHARRGLESERAAVASAPVFDAELAAAEREISFERSDYSERELEQFERKLAREPVHETVNR